MGVKKHVFGSEPEKHNYKKLLRQWGERYPIYHNLPFLFVFNTDELWDASSGNPKPIYLSDTEMNFLKKTYIDYTLCDENDHPLLCVEFDGMDEGFNVGNRYYNEIPHNPSRRRSMDLKLKVAHGSLFPFVVVGSEHFEDISESVRLTIVDGIFGDVLADHEKRAKASKGFSPSAVGMPQEDFDSLPESEKHNMIQDWLFGVEIEAYCTHNPIYRAVDALTKELHVYEHVQWGGYQDPDGAIYKGPKVTVTHPVIGPCSARVNLPNFKTLRISTFTLAKEIAHLIALDVLKRKLAET